MTMERLLHMKGGMGETSYAKNSILQRKVIKKVKTLLDENLLKLMESKKNLNGSWKIADLGCSSGPNTLMAISNILKVIQKISLELKHKKHVFQIYLNDLIENDFNNIFKLLPNFHESMQHETGDNVGACYINATPGTFHGRLFPNYYIDIFHSSYCLHWLSQAPIYSKKKTEPLIKGNIYITRVSTPSVYNVYLEHFERDFNNFLKSRYEELALDGVMVLTIVGRENNGEITSYEVLGMVLNQMVQEGLVEEPKLDLFNLPVYHPTIEEVKQVIKTEESFTIKTLKTFKIGWDANLQQDSKMRGEFISKYHRAVFESLLIAQFGENIMDELFSRFAKLIEQFIELKSPDFTNIVLFMTKNSQKTIEPML